MAYTEGSMSTYNAYGQAATPPTSPKSRRSSSHRDELLADSDVIQGRILWLPPKDELPDRAVRRAHGKGAVEEGIYNHPVVVISRPAQEKSVVHFHLITSFQGKRLDEIYGKNNEFHQSRRSWYLPISPTPPHPDANSKKSKKRFPNLDLAAGAALRWDSYVNLRDVYKVEWFRLRPYGNPDMPQILDFRFERESMIRLMAKGRVLTTYEASEQYRKPTALRIPDEGSFVENEMSSRNVKEHHSPRSETASIVSSAYSSPSSRPQSDFLGPDTASSGSMRRPPKAPPDTAGIHTGASMIQYIFRYILGLPLEILKWLWAYCWRSRDTQ